MISNSSSAIALLYIPSLILHASLSTLSTLYPYTFAVASIASPVLVHFFPGFWLLANCLIFEGLNSTSNAFFSLTFWKQLFVKHDWLTLPYCESKWWLTAVTSHTLACKMLANSKSRTRWSCLVILRCQSLCLNDLILQTTSGHLSEWSSSSSQTIDASQFGTEKEDYGVRLTSGNWEPDSLYPDSSIAFECLNY